ncbi:hypothetical protein [Haloarcula laminariae]|uniref:hypothetical protein n=1 Tax=Haloarcula laminariae TaxID=2961577 RepID=UPI0021C8A3D7|nr:hypothetical protein [Halomicroarcula laminariae]
MSLYNLTYEFESSGGNIEYQTRQTVQKEADINDVDLSVVTTGLSLSDDRIKGIATVDADSDIVTADVFDSATEIHEVSHSWNAAQPEAEPASDPHPSDDVPRFEDSGDMQDLLATVNETPGRGCMFYSNLTRCWPHERDLWFVPLSATEIDASTGLSVADLIGFYRANIDQLEAHPTLKIGCFHQVAEPTIQISLVASLTDPQEAGELAGRFDSAGAMNFHRFELSKASLVVGSSTHGPGQTDATFSAPSGEQASSLELAYRHWYEGLDVSFHPLGVVVDGDLYRPVIPETGDGATMSVGDPLYVETYRGSDAKPWQFGVTRHDEQLLLTQARASPAKFDPVLKRFPIETQVLGDEPLVFSHMVSRRVWSEDPVNLHVQSQRSEGLRTQFLYTDSDGWHLIQPDGLGDPSESADSTFEQTQLPGVSVRSSLLRSKTEADSKATVEHEYRITEDVFDSCARVYALSYHEVNEESIDRLQWDLADATAYDIVRSNPGD